MGRSAFAILWLSTVLFGCLPELGNDLRVHDAGLDGRVVTDAAQVDGAPVDGAAMDGAPVDGSLAADAGPEVPRDEACDSAWTIEEGCDGRQLHVIASQALDVVNLSIARRDDGEVAVVYNDLEWADEGSLEILYFPESDVERVTRESSPGSLGVVAGESSSVSAGPGNVFHVAYWKRSDVGELWYRRREGAARFSEPERIDSDLYLYGWVDLAATEDAVHVLYHDATGNAVRHQQKEAANEWTRQRDLDGRLETELSRSLGEVAVAADEQGVLHLAWQQPASLGRAAAVYKRRIGPIWSADRTLAPGVARTEGVGVDLALSERRRAVAFLSWGEGVGDVVLYQWEVTSDEVSSRTLVAGVEADDSVALSEGLVPRAFPVAIAADEYGLFHVVTVEPYVESRASDGGAAERSLRLVYLREHRSGAGEVTWLRDVIDQRVSGVGQLPRVDLTVGPERRPHITYLDASDGTIRYATIVR